MDLESAYGLIEGAIDAGRPAHGYLIVGDVRGDAMELAERVLERLFGPEHVKDRAHPDIHWLLPEMKTRIISVESMRARIVDPMEKTAFAGGWKAGDVILVDAADGKLTFTRTEGEIPEQRKRVHMEAPRSRETWTTGASGGSTSPELSASE